MHEIFQSWRTYLYAVISWIKVDDVWKEFAAGVVLYSQAIENTIAVKSRYSFIGYENCIFAIEDKRHVENPIRNVYWFLHNLLGITLRQAVQHHFDFLFQWIGTVASGKMEVKMGDTLQDVR